MWRPFFGKPVDVESAVVHLVRGEREQETLVETFLGILREMGKHRLGFGEKGLAYDTAEDWVDCEAWRVRSSGTTCLKLQKSNGYPLSKTHQNNINVEIHATYSAAEALVGS